MKSLYIKRYLSIYSKIDSDATIYGIDRFYIKNKIIFIKKKPQTGEKKNDKTRFKVKKGKKIFHRSYLLTFE